MDAWKEATRWVIDNLFFMNKRLIKDLKYLANWKILQELAGADKEGDRELRQKLETYTGRDYNAITPGSFEIDDRQWLMKSLELLMPIAKGYVTDRFERKNLRYSETNSIAYPGNTVAYLEDGDLYETKIAGVLKEYAAIVAMVLASPFPRELLFRLGLEKLADVVEDSYNENTPEFIETIFAKEPSDKKGIDVGIRKTMKYLDDPWGATGMRGNIEAAFEFALKHYKSRLNHLWLRIENEALYLEPVFGGLYTHMFDTFEKFRRGSECYPDLNLPINKVTETPLDTPPDYWFWNTSVDGAMFYDKKDTAEVAAQFMANSYESMKEFLSVEEWEKNYMSPNKRKIWKKTTGPESNPRAKLATAIADEHGIGKLGNHKIKGEVVEQVFDFVHGHTPPKSLGGTTIQLGGNNEGAEIKPDEALESEDIVQGYSGRLADMLEKSLIDFDSDVYRLARAYPTFKVYFMEEDMTDSGRLGIRNFDDFYSYSAIKDIRVVRSRKIPADLCVISITNIHGELDTLAYGGNDDESSARITEKFNPLTVNTKQENPFTKLVVLEGSKIQVRLGYSNSPEELDTVFTGQVVEVGVSPISPDIMQLVCQSYGTELVAKLKTGGVYSTTSELLSSLICSTECFHFGRYERTAIYDPASVRSATEGNSRAGFLFHNEAFDTLYEKNLKSKNFRNKPQDDNIFSPEFGTYDEWGDKVADAFSVVGITQVLDFFNIIDNDREYHPWRVTIWDVFKEMELRHPGYVSLPVPYGDRYTMFFGPPSHKYWARPLSEIERGGWGRVESFLQTLQTGPRTIIEMGALSVLSHLLRAQAGAPAAQQKVLQQKIANYSLGKRVEKVTDLHGKESSLSTARKQFGEYLKWLTKGRVERYRPFRQYHFLTSENNIIANNLKASAHGTFNAVTLTCLNDVEKMKEVHTQQEAEAEIQKGIQAGVDVIEMKADDNIEDHNTRMMEALYTSCFEEFFGRRYAGGLLLGSLRDVYKGTIVVTGNGKIKPYDVCMLFDTYRDIYGPVEVEQVTHIMSQETGFISEIKPDLILTHNAATTQCTMDAMVQAGAQLFSKIADTVGDEGDAKTTAVAGAATAGAVFGTGVLVGGIGFGLIAFGGYKLVEWSQERQPIVITPVMNGVKPIIAGLDGYKRDSLWASINGRWKKFTTDVEEGFLDWYERSPVASVWHEAWSDLYQPKFE
jgi:hypothetical protein